jgi:RNA polymerase sigma-70 factor (family 1)
MTAVKDGDEAAFTALVKRYWKRCHINAYARVNDQDVAEEIVQDVFMSLWDKRNTSSIQNVSSYLYACVRNKCINHIEHKIKEKKYWDYYKTFLSEQTIIKHHPIDFSSLEEQLDSGIQQLPAKSQLVFRMSRMEGRSIPEIAEALNLSEKAIEYHLTLSLKKLRAHLKDFIVPIIAFFNIF